MKPYTACRIILAAALAMAACGSDDDSSGGTPGSGGASGTGGQAGTGGGGTGGSAGDAGSGGSGGTGATGGNAGAGATGGNAGAGATGGNAGAGGGGCPAIDVPEGSITESELYVARLGFTDIEAANAVIGVDDEIVVAGQNSSNMESRDLMAVRLDSTGNVKWASRFGGDGSDDAIGLVADGGQLTVIGQTQSFGVFGSGWLLSLDAATGAVSDQFAVGAGEGLTLVGGMREGNRMLLAGTRMGSSQESQDFWVASISDANQAEWGRHAGTDDNESANDAALVCNQVIVVGQTLDFEASNIDMYIVAFGLDGELKWQKTIGGSDIDRATAVTSDTDGNVLVAGNSRSFGQGSHDAMVLKLSPEGDLIWGKTVGGAGSDVPDALQQVSDGILMVGRTDTDSSALSASWVTKLDHDGEVLWSKQFAANTDYHSMDDVWLGSGGLHVVGFAEDDDNAADSDWLVMKLSDAGELGGCQGLGDVTVTSADVPASLEDASGTATDESPTITTTDAQAESPSVTPEYLCGP